MHQQNREASWLRRKTDGTADELWIGLRKLLKRFDQKWYRSQRSKYLSNQIEW